MVTEGPQTNESKKVGALKKDPCFKNTVKFGCIFTFTVAVWSIAVRWPIFPSNFCEIESILQLIFKCATVWGAVIGIVALLHRSAETQRMLELTDVRNQLANRADLRDEFIGIIEPVESSYKPFIIVNKFPLFNKLSDSEGRLTSGIAELDAVRQNFYVDLNKHEKLPDLSVISTDYNTYKAPIISRAREIVRWIICDIEKLAIIRVDPEQQPAGWDVNIFDTLNRQDKLPNDGSEPDEARFVGEQLERYIQFFDRVFFALDTYYGAEQYFAGDTSKSFVVDALGVLQLAVYGKVDEDGE